MKRGDDQARRSNATIEWGWSQAAIAGANNNNLPKRSLYNVDATSTVDYGTVGVVDG